ncbi:iron ABC transporter permease [Treponema parvum]|uniref:Iron ABC transporter permease n=1 Tax=Treponema parvum TaxID=138851 RepID=A0A975F5X0_9SPIR|nr:iron ABC transporter permease [Treponema parvum]QTQ14574.1 iron ABC transporter permease [Treponema parvum]
MKNRLCKNTLYTVLSVLPFVLALFCLGVGRFKLSIPETLETLSQAFTGNVTNQMAHSVIWRIRVPRIILSLLVGAGLSVSGAAFQGLFSNPLATPDTIGVASGASFGAVLGLLFDGNLVIVQIMALIFGLLTCLLTYLISRSRGKTSIIMIVLSGMIISAMCQALVSLLKYVADPQEKLPTITYWLMGSLASASYRALILGAPFILCGCMVIFFLRWRINILSLQEDEVKSMGININLMRLIVIVASSMITASCISMCGQVGWVGLLVPHISRMIGGSNNKTVIPLSIVIGASFMLVIDTFARSMTAAEIPVSILTSVIGAPIFIMLLRKTGGIKE